MYRNSLNGIDTNDVRSKRHQELLLFIPKDDERQK